MYIRLISLKVLEILRGTPLNLSESQKRPYSNTLKIYPETMSDFEIISPPRAAGNRKHFCLGTSKSWLLAISPKLSWKLCIFLFNPISHYQYIWSHRVKRNQLLLLIFCLKISLSRSKCSLDTFSIFYITAGNSFTQLCTTTSFSSLQKHFPLCPLTLYQWFPLGPFTFPSLLGSKANATCFIVPHFWYKIQFWLRIIM